MENRDGALIVRTSNSTYRLGPAGPDGFRDVTRDNVPLSFTRGKLLGTGTTCFMGASITSEELKVGGQMAIEVENPANTRQPYWVTSKVTEIEQG